MMSNEIRKYEITQSKTGKWIPIINDVHLHSSFDPHKEAEALADRHEQTLKDKKNILILGLGFAHHVESICGRLQKYHGKDFMVSVIEPCQETISRWREIYPKSLGENVKIYQENIPQDLYAKAELVEFLTLKPGVISHPASFNLYSEYFKAYLTHMAPLKISCIQELIKDKAIQDYLGTFNTDNDLEDLFFNIKKVKPVLDHELDFLFLAYERFIIKKENLIQTKVGG